MGGMEDAYLNMCEYERSLIHGPEEDYRVGDGDSSD